MTINRHEDAGWFADVLLNEAPPAARSTILELLEDGDPPRGIYLQVLAPALAEIGRRWEHGEISVAQEHLATSEVVALMHSLAPLLDEPPPVARSIVLAGTDSSLHTVGLEMVGDFLAGDGWEVRRLGAATPAADLVDFVGTHRMDVVGLSTTLTTHMKPAAETITLLRALPRPPFILVGGLAWGGDEALALQSGADAYAPDAATASEMLRERFPSPDQAVALRRDLARRTEELEHALGYRTMAERRVATLAGMVPLCASCGRIRTEHPTKTDWMRIAAYLRAAGLAVTTGLCATCASAGSARVDAPARPETPGG